MARGVTSKSVKSSLIKAVRHIVIDRADARNALNQAAISELIDAVNAAEADSASKVLLVYGAGDRAFCSGADLKELAASTTLEQRHKFFRSVGKLIEAIYRTSKPVVCKVHGWALAGGMGIIAASDVVLASDDARFGLPEIEVGLIPMVVQKALERVVDARTLSYLALSGEAIDALAAAEAGLVSKVFPKSTLDDDAQAFCEKLAGRSSYHLRAICESIRAKARINLFQEMQDASFRIATFSATADSTQAVKKFLERKKNSKEK